MAAMELLLRTVRLWWRDVLLAFGFGLPTAAALGWLTFRVALLLVPDCKPHQLDGRCGINVLRQCLMALGESIQSFVNVHLIAPVLSGAAFYICG
jgi:hypothetical protein